MGLTAPYGHGPRIAVSIIVVRILLILAALLREQLSIRGNKRPRLLPQILPTFAGLCIGDRFDRLALPRPPYASDRVACLIGNPIAAVDLVPDAHAAPRVGNTGPRTVIWSAG